MKHEHTRAIWKAIKISESAPAFALWRHVGNILRLNGMCGEQHLEHTNEGGKLIATITMCELDFGHEGPHEWEYGESCPTPLQEF